MEQVTICQHIRSRPTMYIGNIQQSGLDHLVQEVLNNAIDERMLGRVQRIAVVLNSDGSVTVEDDGPGIPVEADQRLPRDVDSKSSSLEAIMTIGRRQLKEGMYHGSNHLQGIGLMVVNCFSEWCCVEVSRGGRRFTQRYERGVPVTEITCEPTAQSSGTRITFKPDTTLFEDIRFSHDLLRKRLQELAFLNQGLQISFDDRRVAEEFTYERGVEAFVEFLNRGVKPVHKEVIQWKDSVADIKCSVAMQYTDSYRQIVRSFVNNIQVSNSGSLLTGLLCAIQSSIEQVTGERGQLAPPHSSDDHGVGLTAVISIYHPEPNLQGPTRTELVDENVEKLLHFKFGQFLSHYLVTHLETAQAIVKRRPRSNFTDDPQQ